MKYVYLIRSIPHPDQTYIGLTSDIKSRIHTHNMGQTSHTAKYKPWELVTYCAFTNEFKAVAFERYLKTGSGRAFANKRLW